MKKLALLAIVCLAGNIFAGVAVTEFINNVNGDEDRGEWVEVFNYGPGSVDLSNMYISDNGFTTQQITSTSHPLAPGSYAVLTFDKVYFTNEWPGVSPAIVVQMDTNTTWNLANSDDQIVLYDSGQNRIWNIGYPNGESAGYSTYLTLSNSWTITDYGYDGGVESGPGIDREGNDVPVGSGLGYENGDSANGADPYAWTAGGTDADIASPGAGPYVSVPEPAFLGIAGIGLLLALRRK